MLISLALAGGGAGVPSATRGAIAAGPPAAATDPAPGAPATADPAPATATFTWARVDAGPVAQAITAFDGGWVAVGSRSGVASASRSGDGVTWEPAITLPVPEGRTVMDVTGVVATSAGLVAVGSTAEGGAARGIAWRSADGTAWELASGPLDFDLGTCVAGCPTLGGVAAGSAGTVTVGMRVIGEDEATARSVAHAWWTADGAAWTRSRLPAPPARPGASVSVSGVAATRTGFIAIGAVCGDRCRAAAWTSPDGRHWRDPVLVTGGLDTFPQDVAVRGRTIVIVGGGCGDGGCTATLWTRRSGEWSRTTVRGLEPPGGAVAPLVVLPDGFALLGHKDGRVRLWRSADGLAWTREAVPTGVFDETDGYLVADMAGAEAGLVVVGEAGEAETPTAWVAR